MVEQSLNEFKQAIDNAYYVNDLVTENINNLKNSISSNPFHDILTPLVKTRFYGNKNYSWIVESSYDELFETRVLVSWNTYSNINGFNLTQLDENKEKTITLPNNDTVTYQKIKEGLEVGKANMLKKTVKSDNERTYVWFSEWAQGIQIEVNIIRPNPLNKNTWLSIGASVSMSDYTTLNVYNIETF